MAGNSFGNRLVLTSFGESHGVAIGGVLDGMPANFPIDLDKIQLEMDRRKPGQSKIVTARKEADQVEFLSGIFEGRTTGTPIGFTIKNTDQRSKDYSNIKDVYRPSHADYVYDKKYGNSDYRGGGRSSARETAVRVVAGAIAKQYLESLGIEIQAYVSSVGAITLHKTYDQLSLDQVESNMVRCPDAEVAAKMEAHILAVKKAGDSIGGVVSCVVKKVPVGLGEPVFDRLNAELAKAMFSINAVKGFELGSGFEGTKMKGSEHNDIPFVENGEVHFKSNHSGGIQAGISNGADIYFNVAFKPVATILQKQDTLNKDLEVENIQIQGRHDPCVVPRAVPIVEAMAALVILDYWLLK
jgi:chorismate synthase